MMINGKALFNRLIIKSKYRSLSKKEAAQHVAAGDLAKALRENVGMRFVVSC